MVLPDSQILNGPLVKRGRTGSRFFNRRRRHLTFLLQKISDKLLLKSYEGKEGVKRARVGVDTRKPKTNCESVYTTNRVFIVMVAL